MDSVRSMRAFVRCIEMGSLSAVARDLKTTQPTISKIISGLEHQLQVRLLERTTTGLTPTGAGSHFYEHAKRILEDYDEAISAVRGETLEASGLLRINAPLGFGEMHLNRLVQEFLDVYPNIQVELILNDRFVDLVEEGVDLAIRLGGTLPPNVVARTLARSSRILAASPDYVSRSPRIREVNDLTKHEFIRFAWLAGGSAIELTGPTGSKKIELPSRYTVNSALNIRQAVADGRAIGLVPTWLVADLMAEGKLVRVLPKWSAASHDLRAIYPTRRYQPARTRLFIDFLVKAVRDIRGLDAPPDTQRI